MISRVPTRTCCCCVPSRAGVVIFALFGIALGSIITGLGCLRIKDSEGSKVSLVIEVVVCGILALVSLLGLIGALARLLGLIKFYFAMLIVHLLISFGTGAFATYRIFHDAPAFVGKCINNNAGPDASKVCTDGASVTKAIVIGLFILLWLFEIWGCIIINSYAQQLREERTAERVVKDNEAW